MRFTTLLFTAGWLTLTIQPAAVASTYQIGRAEQQDQPHSTAGIISATILDESGEPMMGVTVQVSGSKTVYITDAKGYFEFKTTKPSETIRLSFIGYKAKSITLQAGKSQRIALDPDSETLTDVVITGFTKKDKKSFTGSQTTVKAKELLSMGTKNLLESLEAFVPGLQIVQQNNLGSDPNARPDLNLRGRATFSGAANLPLFVVDGAIVDVNYIYDMDMNTIESVTVLRTPLPLLSMGRRLLLGSSSSPPSLLSRELFDLIIVVRYALPLQTSVAITY